MQLHARFLALSIVGSLTVAPATVGAQEWPTRHLPASVEPAHSARAVDARPDGEASILGSADELQVQALSPVTSVRSSGPFRLQLSETSTPTQGDGQALVVDAARPTALLTWGRVGLQVAPGLDARFDIRSQRTSEVEVATTTFGGHLDWQPWTGFSASVLAESAGGNGTRLGSRLAWKLAPLSLSWEWQHLPQAGYRSDEVLAAQVENLGLGSQLRLSLFGRYMRSGATFRNSLGGDLNVDFGPMALLGVRFESDGQDGWAGRSQFLDLHLRLLPVEHLSFGLRVETGNDATGVARNALGSDLRLQASPDLQVSAGYERRAGFNGVVDGYAVLNDRLNLAAQWPHWEFRYSHTFAVPGQVGGDSLSLRFNSNF